MINREIQRIPQPATSTKKIKVMC